MTQRSIVPPYARDERMLILAAKGGNELALAYLVRRYEPVRRLIQSQSYKLDVDGRHRDDLCQAGVEGVIKALRRFDPSRGVRFATYAYHDIRSEMFKTLYPGRKESRVVDGQPVQMISTDIESDEADGGSCYDHERELYLQHRGYGVDRGFERALNADRDAAVRRFVDTLGESQKGIVVDLFWNDKTHVEIAAERGVSRPAITRALARATKRAIADLAAYQGTLAA